MEEHVIVVEDRIPAPKHKPTRPTTKFLKSGCMINRTEEIVTRTPTMKSMIAKTKLQFHTQWHPPPPPPPPEVVVLVVVVV
jgi:hypothetical protein